VPRRRGICSLRILFAFQARLMEIRMNNRPDPDQIAEEAVGQRHDSPPPHAVKENESPEDAIRRGARSAGADASTSEKTAESVGERVGDAYSDAGSVAQTQRRSPGSQAPIGSATEASGAANGRPLLMAAACFALGYATAVLFHSRINAYLSTAPGQFQILRPPQGDGHPRGFVQSTVLKTITEHPQGMTMSEVIKELGPQGIGQQSIVNALGLVEAKKVSLHDKDGKYIPAAAEVPTAPDQPSS
jgi:hypothetical protein